MQLLPLSLDFEDIHLISTLELLQATDDMHCGERTLLRGGVNNLTQAHKESAQMCLPCPIIWDPGSKSRRSNFI